MKKFLTAITTAVFLLLPATGFAGYVIHLKDLATISYHNMPKNL